MKFSPVAFLLWAFKQESKSKDYRKPLFYSNLFSPLNRRFKWGLGWRFGVFKFWSSISGAKLYYFNDQKEKVPAAGLNKMVQDHRTILYSQQPPLANLIIPYNR